MLGVLHKIEISECKVWIMHALKDYDCVSID